MFLAKKNNNQPIDETILALGSLQIVEERVVDEKAGGVGANNRKGRSKAQQSNS